MQRFTAVLLSCACAASMAQAQVQVQVREIAHAQPLTALPGDPVQGRAIVANRQLGLCLLCHTGPIAEERFQGSLAPDLAGAGARWNAAQLRARIVDPSRFNPGTIMPAYFKADALVRIPASLRGKTILTGQQIEDVVAYLQTLRLPPEAPPP